MALTYIDGYDHYVTADLTKKWNEASGGSAQIHGGGLQRTGAGCLQLQGTGGYVMRTIPATDVLIQGWAERFGVLPLPANGFVSWFEGATMHIGANIDASGFLVVKRSTTTLATATSHAFSVNNWYYLEFKIVIHDTTGSIEVRVDGVPVTFNASLTGIDTRNGGTSGVIDRFYFAGVVSPYLHIDDLYVCDDAGSTHVDFLGSCKVETLLPLTDAVAAGTHGGFTPSTGTDHGALVDDAAANTTDYNSSATIGAKDTYHYPALTLTGEILGLQTNLWAAKSDAAVRQVCAVVRTGGTEYDGANVSPLTTFKCFPEIRAQNPQTAAAWTTADIAALEVGMKVTV